MSIDKCNGIGMNGELVEMVIPVFDVDGTRQLSHLERLEFVAAANGQLTESVLNQAQKLAVADVGLRNYADKLGRIEMLIETLTSDSTAEDSANTIIAIAEVLGRKNPYRHSIENEMDRLQEIYGAYENMAYELTSRMKRVDVLMSELDDYESDGGFVTEEDYDELIAKFDRQVEDADDEFRLRDYY